MDFQETNKPINVELDAQLWPEPGPVINFASREDCQAMLKILAEMNNHIFSMEQRIKALEGMSHHKNWALGQLG